MSHVIHVSRYFIFWVFFDDLNRHCQEEMNNDKTDDLVDQLTLQNMKKWFIDTFDSVANFQNDTENKEEARVKKLI